MNEEKKKMKMIIKAEMQRCRGEEEKRRTGEEEANIFSAGDKNNVLFLINIS